MNRDLYDFQSTKRRTISTFLNKLAVVFLVLSTIERIDIFRENGSFRLTPAVLMAAIFLICFLTKILSNKNLHISYCLLDYIKIISMFILIIFISSCFSADWFMTFKRSSLLLLYIISGFFAINYLYLHNHDHFKTILVECITIQVIVYLFCSIIDIVFWLSPSFQRAFQAIFPIYNTQVWTIGGNFLRVRGASEDPNRAGIFLVICIFFLLFYKKPSLLRTIMINISIVMIILTVSRTAMLCLAMLLLIYYTKGLKRKNKLKTISKSKFFISFCSLLFILGFVFFLLSTPFITQIIEYLPTRFTERDGSSDTHIELIFYGLRIAFNNLKIFLLGNGYGASAEILTAVFQGPASKNYNFHNAFVSFFVECGIFAMIIFIYLIIRPLMKNKALLPIIAVIVLANIPYQIYAEAYFWYIMPFLYILADEKRANKQGQRIEGSVYETSN